MGRIQRWQHARILEVRVHGDQRPASTNKRTCCDVGQGGAADELLAAVPASRFMQKAILQDCKPCFVPPHSPQQTHAHRALLEVLRRLHELQHAGKQRCGAGHAARLALWRIIQHHHLQGASGRVGGAGGDTCVSWTKRSDQDARQFCLLLMGPVMPCTHPPRRHGRWRQRVPPALLAGSPAPDSVHSQCRRPPPRWKASRGGRWWRAYSQRCVGVRCFELR